jgi:Winged helix DNA-binding domain
MVNTSSKKDLPSYLRFIQLVESIGFIKLSPELDDIEVHLLDRISIDVLSGKQVLVGEVLAFTQFGSQATIHNRIKSLTANGYLSTKIDQMDARRKYLIPTPLAKKRYEALSKALLRAASFG